MAHAPLEELAANLAAAREQITVGALYAHYKHPDVHYRVTGLAIQEADEAVAVLYERQEGERITFVRPLVSWLETIEVDGARLPRFVRVESL